MKKNLKHQIHMFWALGALFLALGVNQSPAIGEMMIPVLKTSGGEYRNVRVFSHTGTHLSFSHETGTAVIKVADLEAESVTAIEQSATSLPDGNGQVPGALVMIKPQPPTTPEPVWLAQTKQLLERLQLGVAPLELSRKQVWMIFGALAFLWWAYSLCASLICKKAGQPGGLLVWLPVLQVIPLFRAARMSGWWFVAMFIPLLNLIGQLVWCVKITQARGKGFFTAVMLILPGTNLLAFLYLACSNGKAKAEDTFALVRPPHALAVSP